MYETLSTIILGLIGVTFVGNLLAVPFVKGHRLMRVGRAFGFLIIAIIAALAAANNAPSGQNETPFQLGAELVFDVFLALGFTFLKASHLESDEKQDG